MRRIDKTVILSSEYKKWLDKLNRDKVKHPSTNRTYYCDVVMNLLYCQKAVCAYTEMLICDPMLLTEDKWENGRYKSEKPSQLGSLEHFDPRLKMDKFWEWDNLFVIHSKINVIKRDSEVDYILKPDSPEYDPMKLLDYDEFTHHFIPHTEIEDETLRTRIQRMIDVLQLNHGTVRYERETFFYRIAGDVKTNKKTEIDRFFTAYDMTKDRL